MADIQVGKVTHYFDKIEVAVIDVTKPLKVGEWIKISGHDSEFEQQVHSLQMEHEAVTKVAKGVSCGMKVDKPVKEGDVLYRLPKHD